MKEYNLDKMNQLTAETWKLIDGDSLLSSNKELGEIRENFEKLQEAIENKWVGQEKGFIANILQKISWDQLFKYSTFEGKINAIFVKYDLVLSSVENTVEMYQWYGEGLLKEIESLSSYLSEVNENIDSEERTASDTKLINSYVTMLDNLKMSLARVEMSMNSAKDMMAHMRVSRPIFQWILSACMIEIAGQTSISASLQITETMSQTISGMSDKLTDSAIRTSQLSLAVSEQPILAAQSMQSNMMKLGAAIKELEDRHPKILILNEKNETTWNK